MLPIIAISTKDISVRYSQNILYPPYRCPLIRGQFFYITNLTIIRLLDYVEAFAE